MSDIPILQSHLGEWKKLQFHVNNYKFKDHKSKYSNYDVQSSQEKYIQSIGLECLSEYIIYTPESISYCGCGFGYSSDIMFFFRNLKYSPDSTLDKEQMGKDYITKLINMRILNRTLGIDSDESVNLYPQYYN